MSFVIWQFCGDGKDEHISTDISRVLKGGQLGYGARSYFLLDFSTSLLNQCIVSIVLFECIGLLYWEAQST